MHHYKKVLTIAGSDSGGGAGIQADLKTFSACGCFGMSAITAITAQNTCGVTDIHPVPTSTIDAQIRAVLDDIGVEAIKIGMLHSKEVVLTLVAVLEDYGCENVVFDPVMVATSGDPLIENEAIEVIKEALLPNVRVITPNIPEAEILLGKKIRGNTEVAEAARQLSVDYSLSVLVKAGHLEGKELTDVLWDDQGQTMFQYTNKRITTQNTHGTGCTLSSAIVAYLAQGLSLDDAVLQAEKYLHTAIEAGSKYKIGKGHGPVHHFHKFW